MANFLLYQQELYIKIFKKYKYFKKINLQIKGGIKVDITYILIKKCHTSLWLNEDVNNELIVPLKFHDTH